MTKLPNGLVVASMENNSPVFRVAAVVQAGAKYEPYESRGVTTLLRVFSNLVTTRESTYAYEPPSDMRLRSC